MHDDARPRPKISRLSDVFHTCSFLNFDIQPLLWSIFRTEIAFVNLTKEFSAGISVDIDNVRFLLEL